MQGKVIERSINDAKVFVGDLPSGTYRIRLEIKGRIEQQAFIRQ
jgi:hypothetical protein